MTTRGHWSIQGGDDAGGHRSLKTQRRSNGDGEIPNRDRIGVSQSNNRKIVRVDLQHRQVICGVSADNLRVRAVAVLEENSQRSTIGRGSSDMVIGQDVSIRTNHKARSAASLIAIFDGDGDHPGKHRGDHLRHRLRHLIRGDRVRRDGRWLRSRRRESCRTRRICRVHRLTDDVTSKPCERPHNQRNDGCDCDDAPHAHARSPRGRATGARRLARGRWRVTARRWLACSVGHEIRIARRHRGRGRALRRRRRTGHRQGVGRRRRSVGCPLRGHARALGGPVVTHEAQPPFWKTSPCRL